MRNHKSSEIQGSRRLTDAPEDYAADYEAGGSRRRLTDMLEDYAAGDVYPFHMPGHKRRAPRGFDPYAVDITEIDGFDDLHHAEGILKRAQDAAARLYGAEETLFLVNGSTAGILTAISAVSAAGRSRKKRSMIVARNCHRSVYHAIYLNHLTPVYVCPGEREDSLAGSVDPADVRAALAAHPDACGVVITSPTYDGIVSDVGRIAEAAHAAGAALIVDEAHGAHFGMHPALPETSVRCGADLVIQSLHKTLPALTQTALLHVRGGFADPALVHRFSAIYQTSSPSYMLMSAMDECIALLEESRTQLFDRWLQQLEAFHDAVRSLRVLTLLPVDDPAKLVISGGGQLSGVQICDMLRKNFHLEPEMGAGSYALCISTIFDTKDGLDRLADALLQMDAALVKERRASKEDVLKADIPAMQDGEVLRRISAVQDRTPCEKMQVVQDAADPEDGWISQEDAARCGELPEAVLPLWQAWDLPGRKVLLEESAGEIAGEFVYLYPPGIPMIVPGERISLRLLSQILSARDNGCTLHGLEDPAGKRIRVCTAD